MTRERIVGTIAGRVEGHRALSAPIDAPVYGGSLAAFLGDSEPATDPASVYWCDGLVVRGEPGLILGEPKIGKTLVVEDLAVCLAAGAPAFCGRPIYQRARVLLMTREDSDRTTRARLWQLLRARDVVPAALEGWLEVDGTRPLLLDSGAHVAHLRRALARFDVVFIDSLSTIHGGDENMARDMAPVMNVWRALALETGTAIVLVHHLRKPGEGRPVGAGGRALVRSRGSSVIAATARHAVCLGDGPRPGQLTVLVEGNHDGRPAPFVVERQSGDGPAGRWVRHELVADAGGAPRRPEARRAVAPGRAVREAADGRGRGADAADRVREVLRTLGAASRNQIVRASGGNRVGVLAAVDALAHRGELVEVHGARSGGRWPLALVEQLGTLGLRAIDRGQA